jgi:tyrocidine synthetase-3
MKKVLEFLGGFREKGIHLSIDQSGTQLKLKGNIASLSAHDKEELALHKAAILALLKDSGAASAFSSIAAVAEQEHYALSSSQMRLWVLSQFEAGSVAYNIPVTSQFEGKLDVALFSAALQDLIVRHEILRTVFRENEQGEVRQYVQAPSASGFELEYVDLRQEAQPDLAVQALLKRATATAFDLQNGPLLRASLLQLQPEKWVFTCTLHHIISDAWSMQVLIRELLVLYNTKVSGQPSPLAPLRIHYKDYAAWQEQQLSSTSLQIHRAYWLQQLAGELPVLALPTDKARPAVSTYNGAAVQTVLEAPVYEALKARVQENGSTLFMGLLAAVNTLLYRYTQQQDFVIGSPIAGREHVDLNNQIGFYVNTLALRTRFEGTDSFSQLLLKTRKTVVDAYEHQIYPFERLVDDLQIKRDISRNALFDVMVVLQNAERQGSAEQQLGDVKVSALPGSEQVISKLDLTFNFFETETALRVQIEYNTDIYSRPTVERISRHLTQLLAAAVANPTTPLQQLSYLTAVETHQLVATFNATENPYPTGQTLVTMFEEQVRRTPHQVALFYEGTQMTYAELHQRSNQFAAFLRSSHAIQADDLVGLQLVRHERMIMVMLGVLKAGGAYVPIDPDFPQERIDYLVADSACKVLIDEQGLAQFEAQAHQYSPQDLAPVARPTDLAYVIYTSGSTGKPKGVMIEHRSIINTILAQQEVFEVYEGEKSLQFASASFDASVTDIYVALTSGGALYIVPDEKKKNPLLLQDYITEHEISMLDITPSYLRLIDIAQIKSLKKLMTGGEAAVVDKVREFSQYGVYFNVYGPTECSVVAAMFRIDQGAATEMVNVPIGSPIANMQLYIVDEQTNLQPVGVVGELCIAGVGLARGYLNAPELTAQKFVANPFEAGERMYKTGDLARWLPDGTVEYIGRKDNQVKVRGYRIELGEIEHVLQRHPQVESALVVAQRGASGDTELIAYLTGISTLALSDIRLFLKQTLPAYMVPSHFICLETMPVTVNGKVNKSMLPSPKEAGMGMGTGKAHVEPRNATEEKLAAIWRDILEKQTISAQDDFFELGGHSLKANRLVSRLNKDFGVKISLADVFNFSVLEQQVQLIEQSRKAVFTHIPAVASQNGYPLSSAQRRLWVLSQLEGGNAAYNIPGAYVFEGNLNEAALAQALQALVARHESLRTVFREDETGEIRQFILLPEEVGFRLAEEDLRGSGAPEEKAKQLVLEMAAKPFDLAAGPLLQAGLYRVSPTSWVFACAMHHIISDGWSMLLLVRELLQLYNAHGKAEAPALAPLRIQYKDYATWQQAHVSGEAANGHKDFWQRKFAGELPTLLLPGDKARPTLKTYNGDAVVIPISADLTKELRALVQEQGATLFMGLLAAVNTLLYRYSGQEDIVIGTVVAGREHSDLESQIGLYLNTLALRNQFSGADSFRSLLNTIKEDTLQAYQHQDYPFDEVVEVLRLQHDKSRNPLFDVSVVLQIADMVPGEELAQDDLQVKAYQDATHYISKFDLSFDFIEVGEGLHTTLVFNTDIYHKRSVEQLGRHLVQLLAAIVGQPEAALESLDYLSSAEKALLTTTFNDTAVAYPRDKSIVTLFAEQAASTPDKVAVAFEDTVLTYQQLHEQTDKLAAYLRNEAGVLPGDCVGMLLDRSEKVIIAILGILKAGAAYVPIEVEYPRARQEFIVADTGIQVLITQTDYMFDLDFYTGSMFAIDVQLDDLEQADSALVSTGPQDLAYVMYTSGSTGKPKGVLVDHRSVVRLVKSSTFVPFTGEEVLLATGALAFDATTFEYWGMLLNGGQLVLTRRDVLLDTKALAAEIKKRKVSVMWFTAGWLNQLVDVDITLFAGLETLVAGGDKLSPPHIKRLLQTYPGLKIVNGYGPTENTTFSLTYPVTEAATAIPVGKPISNSQAYVLDHRQGVLPVGAVGEIVVGGDGLARGYLNQPALTEEKFIPNPFREGTRLYRTGDLGRWLPDGNIAFIGRTDDQVKIRGFRVELAEIENVIQQISGIDTAVVLAKANAQAEKELVAYLVGASVPSPAEVKAYLSAHLPAYMVPTHFVHLEAFPLTLNGKINKDALPAPDGADNKALLVEPRNEQEAGLADIWKQLLGKDSVGVTDNFFEIGGDSIKILRMVSEARRHMSLDIAVADIYKYGTIENILVHTLQDQERTSRRAAAEAQVAAEINGLKERVLAASPAAERENIEDVFPMSDIEKGMVYESLVQVGAGIYHDQLLHQRAYPGFDLGRFRQALRLLVSKHAILRTSFHLGEFESEVQLVHTAVAVDVPFQDLSSLSLQEQEDLVKAFLVAEHQQPFEVTNAPLWRMNAFGLGADEVLFVLQFHHAIMDGWSHASFVTELNNLYLTLGQNPAYKPGALKSSYRDFVIQHETDRKDHAVRAYWQQELEGYKRLDLFTEEPVAFASYTRAVEPDYQKKIEKLATELHTSVKTVSLTAYLYLLRLLTYEGDVVAGIVTNTRPGCEDSDKVLGCFLNTVPLRLLIDEELNPGALITSVHEKLIKLKENERLSLLEISRLHDVQQQAGNPFFDTFFNYIDFHAYESLQEGEPVAPEANVRGNTRTNIHLDASVEMTGGRYSASFTLGRKMKSGHTAADLGQLYFNILDYFLQHTRQPLRHGEYLAQQEKRQLLHDYNETSAPYARNSTITELLAAQAQQSPDRTAVVFGDTAVSYQRLHESSNQLARFLQERYAIQPDELIGLKLERSDKLIMALLGILKSGAAYVPIDPDYPQERIDYIVADSACRLIIDEAVLHSFSLEMSLFATDDLPLASAAHNLAYVIYTSGSTGKPKGCGVTHRNLLNYITWANGYYFGETGRANFGLYTSLSFDLTVTSIYSTLTQGGELYVYPQKAEITDILEHSFSGSSAIDAVKLTPSHINVLAALDLTSPAVSCAIVGGEQITAAQVRALHRINPGMKVHNEYGPTEATVGCVIAELRDDETILIGKPIANTQVYVLNSAGMLAPKGVTGELYVGGESVARGYLNRPELTAERFQQNPFTAGTKLYGTGDLVRWTPQGELEYLGRKDDQVKIRGHRVELGEVESALCSHPEISAAAALVHTTGREEKELLAYFTASSPLQAPALRLYLSKIVPAHMLPGHYIQLDALPLSPNGKLDRKQLPAPSQELQGTGVAYLAPRTPTEARLQLIWQDILGRENISVKENFFDAGGHSIKVTRLASHIYKAFEVKVPLATLFAVAVLEEQAQLLDQAGKTAFTAIPALPQQAHYPLSSAQRRLWILSQFEGESEAYNIPAVYVLEGPLDAAAMNSAFLGLISRHEILRTVFQEDSSGEVQQVIKAAGETGFAISYQSASSQEALEKLVEQAVTAPFDLAAGPLLRATIIDAGAGKWVLAYVMHHIISDGWSANIMLHELLRLYRAHQHGVAAHLTPLRIQYKEYAAWQLQQLASPGFEQHKSFWLNTLSGELPVLELPRHKMRPAVKTHNGATLQVRISPEPARELLRLARDQQATLFMALLATVNTLLYSQTGQQDIIVGSPVAGRQHADLEDQVGFYLNTLPLRTRFAEDYSFRELLSAVQQVTLNAYEHQAYPFDALVEALQLPRDASRNFLFDVWVVLHNAAINTLGEEHLPEGLKVSSFDGSGQHASKFDLLFSFAEAGEELTMALEYNTDLFSSKEAAELAEQFTAIITHVTAHPDTPLREVRELFAQAALAHQQEHLHKVRMKNISRLTKKSF